MMDEPEMVAGAIGVAIVGGLLGLALVVLLVLRRIPQRAVAFVVTGSVLALGFAALAVVGLATRSEPDHGPAMSQCVYYESLDYPHLSQREATAKAQQKCDEQLAAYPDSFDWMWLS